MLDLLTALRSTGKVKLTILLNAILIYTCTCIFNVLSLRFFKHQMRHLSHLSSDLDHGNICPACPKVISILKCVYALCVMILPSNQGLCTN